MSSVNKQWVTGNSNAAITLPLAFSSKKLVTVATPIANEWLYESTTIIRNNSLADITVYCASENQNGTVMKSVNIFSIGV